MCYETGKSAQTFYEVLEYEEKCNAGKTITNNRTLPSATGSYASIRSSYFGDRFYAHPQARALAPRLQFMLRNYLLRIRPFIHRYILNAWQIFNLSYDTKTVTELSEARSRQSANPITPTRTRTFDIDIVRFYKRMRVK